MGHSILCRGSFHFVKPGWKSWRPSRDSGRSVRIVAVVSRPTKRRSPLCWPTPGLVCRVDAAIVGKPFERVRSLDGGEPALNGLQHHVANHAAADAGVGDRMPSNDLAVVSIDDEGQAYQVTVPAGDLESV